MSKMGKRVFSLLLALSLALSLAVTSAFADGGEGGGEGGNVVTTPEQPQQPEQTPTPEQTQTPEQPQQLDDGAGSDVITDDGETTGDANANPDPELPEAADGEGEQANLDGEIDTLSLGALETVGPANLTIGDDTSEDPAHGHAAAGSYNATLADNTSGLTYEGGGGLSGGTYAGVITITARDLQETYKNGTSSDADKAFWLGVAMTPPSDAASWQWGFGDPQLNKAGAGKSGEGDASGRVDEAGLYTMYWGGDTKAELKNSTGYIIFADSEGNYKVYLVKFALTDTPEELPNNSQFADDLPSSDPPAASSGGTTTNEDGSKTTTVTNSDGSVTATTTTADGSVTATTTATDGSKTTEATKADGSTGTVKTDANGNTVSAEAKVSAKAVSDAAAAGESVKLPVEVKAASSAESAAAIDVTMPEDSGTVTVDVPVTDVTDTTVAVLVHADGTEEIVKMSAVSADGVLLSLSGSATIKIVDNAKSFSDVSGHWAESTVAWAASHEIMNGMGDGGFSPDASMSRAMLAQMLFNIDGAKSDGHVTSAFADVSEGQWFAESVTWAYENGIAQGSDGSFNVNQDLTREQMVVMIYNYAKGKGYDTTPSASLSEFTDAGSVASWAQDAMAWAVDVGLIGGMGDGTVAPQGSATRAQLATIMQRFVVFTLK